MFPARLFNPFFRKILEGERGVGLINTNKRPPAPVTLRFFKKRIHLPTLLFYKESTDRERGERMYFKKVSGGAFARDEDIVAVARRNEGFDPQLVLLS